ncbi:MAG: CcmD family protein [Cyclobacteriaceae bacterium]|nr:CcmD family protein [Cyclobacteriaceae bacterium]
MKKISSLLLLIMISITASSQQEVEMADTMRSEGKIYVVVAIMLVVLAGIVAYLVSIDRKASRLEKKLDELGKR